jgi:hypothetical protein
MVRPTTMIVLTANQRQKLTSWARGGNDATALGAPCAHHSGQCCWTRFTATGAAGTDESNNGAALAGALRGGRLRRAAGSTTPWPAVCAGTDNTCPGRRSGVRTTC